MFKTAWSGKIHDAQGRQIAGPRQAAFISRNKPHRGVGSEHFDRQDKPKTIRRLLTRV